MKRVLSILLTVTLLLTLLTLLPLSALAYTGGGTVTTPEDPPPEDPPPTEEPIEPTYPEVDISPPLELAPPETLLWGQYWTGSELVNEPGYVCFSAVEGAVGYDIVVWKLENGGRTAVHEPSLQISGEQDPWIFLFVASEIQPGQDYLFTVRAVGDDRTYTDSIWVDSQTWTYTAPQEKLEIFNVSWDEANYRMEWSVNNYDLLAYCEYELYRAETEDGESQLVHTDIHEPQYGGPFADTLMMAYGPGWYTFRMRAVSKDADQAEDSDWSAFSEPMQFGGATEYLGIPSGLTWHADYHDDVATVRAGSIAFRRAVPDQHAYKVMIFGGSSNYYENEWYYYEGDDSAHFSMNDFIYMDPESGSYRFVVYAMGDGVNYLDGDLAASEVWDYTAPETRLPTPTGLNWTEEAGKITLNWTPLDTDCYYEVAFWNVADEEYWGEGDSLYNSYGVLGDMDLTVTTYQPDDFELEMLGEGKLRFRVRAISRDITVVRNSEWSEVSPAFFTGDITELVEEELEAVDPSGAAADIRDSVAAIEGLDTALSLDTGNDGTAALLKELDEVVGTTTVEVEDVTEFNAAEVQIYGAALNNAGDATLTIGQPKHGETAPELQDSEYRNTLRFSMDITAPDADGETDGHQLAIPVKLVLPVPQDINPAFLVVLHHKLSDNSWEVVEPYVYQEGGKWFASFVVDSFSDFAFANGMKVTETGENSLLVELTLSDPDAIFLCALYDGDDKMLDVAEISSGDADGILEYGRGTPSYLRLFTLDSQCRPTDNFMIVGLHEE
ncbi:MAG: hypothetical protein IKU58_10175 [Clostridia bacterium]|nr:hypothetical protein [Clostridia bacterium]